ncbi:hypothetical protein NQU49_25310, partial [Escherichia coli]|nr:hypothetical protein [Escherichia coli]
ELGYNAVTNGPFGYAFPVGVDPAIKERMDKALADVMQDETVTKQITTLGIQAIYRNGKDYAALLKSLETELVRTARATGCRVLDGGGMAVFQAVDAFRLITDVEPDAARM